MKKLKFADTYKKENTYPFPNENIGQSEKGEGYFLAAMNAIASKFFMNQCAVPYDAWGQKRTFAELRAYRTGRNDPNKYKNFIIGKAGSDGKRKTTLNISWDILQILPQKMDVVFGFIQKLSYDVNAEAIDYEALMDKKTQLSIAKVVSDIRMDAIINSINQNPTVNITKPSMPKTGAGIQLNSPQDVDLAQSIGILLLEEEAAMENLLDRTKTESGSDAVADLQKDDLLTLSYAGKYVFTNPNTSIVEEKYIDVDHAAFPHSEYRDYRDITWSGHWEKYSIARLRRETDIKDKELVEIAEKYYSNGNYNSSTPNFYGSAQGNDSLNYNMIDQIEVDVWCGAWIGDKNIKITSVTREKEGNLVVNKVNDDYELKKKDADKGKQLHAYSNKTIYKAKMVLGSSYVFDYGEDTDINYKKDINGNKWPVFPYRFSRTGNSSLVERCISFVDDANLANLKLRVARAKMPAPPNLFIDKAAFENVKIDGVTFKPHQLMKILQDEGYLIGDSKNQWGQTNNGSRPITPIGTDLMSVISAWWEDMGRCIDMIEKVTGINDVFAAQTPQRQTGLGVSNLLVQGAQNALTPIIRANEYLEQGGMFVASSKWQCLAKYLPDEQRKKLSIGRSLEIISVSEKLFDYDFDIKISLTLNDEQKQELLGELVNMRSAARQGGIASMSENDFLICESMIRSGKIKQAQLYTAFAVEKRKKEAQEEQMQSIQANAQTQQASAEQKAQSDAQGIQLQGQVDGQLQGQKEQMQGQQAIQLEIVKSQARMNEIRLQASLNENKKSA